MLYFNMGEREFYQPLTSEDKITVVLYRTGIFLSTAVICAAAALAVLVLGNPDLLDQRILYSGLAVDLLILALYFSVGLSVFFIHLYVGKFHRILKKVYYLAAACLVILFVFGNGSPASVLFGGRPLAALLLIPISLCLGFVTAKEAFCFQLVEGYLLAFLMPAYIFSYSTGIFNQKTATYGLALVAGLLLIFMFRKVFQPVHYDIGDKSAYQP
jgi:uncharacterized integral membrane protein